MLLVMVELIDTFLTRAAEHISISYLTGKRVKNVNDSAVSHQLLRYDRTIDFDRFDILASNTN